jgi:hypothetical protein
VQPRASGQAIWHERSKIDRLAGEAHQRSPWPIKHAIVVDSRRAGRKPSAFALEAHGLTGLEHFAGTPTISHSAPGAQVSVWSR